MTEIGKPGVRFYSSRGELYLRKMESKRDVCTGCLCNFWGLGHIGDPLLRFSKFSYDWFESHVLMIVCGVGGLVAEWT